MQGRGWVINCFRPLISSRATPMTDHEVTRLAAQEALAACRFEEAISAANELVEAGEPWLIDGLLRRALALENWIDGPSDRFVAAASDWRNLVGISPSSISFGGLARVLMKLGQRDAAMVNLIEAQARGSTPELMLGFAEFYRTASPPDLEQAKTYLRRAALRGRMLGMRGYVEVASALDQPFSAIGMTVIAVVAAPSLALVLGERRHADF